MAHLPQYQTTPYMAATSFPFTYAATPTSANPALSHPPLSRTPSNSSFSSPTFGSPGHQGEALSPGSECGPLSPPPQHPGMWPPQSQPLFSLANVLSMAMSMAHSFIPATTLASPMTPSMPPALAGFHSPMPHHVLPQHSYPFGPNYQVAPGESSYHQGAMAGQPDIYQRAESHSTAQERGFAPMYSGIPAIPHTNTAPIRNPEPTFPVESPSQYVHVDTGSPCSQPSPQIYGIPAFTDQFQDRPKSASSPSASSTSPPDSPQSTVSMAYVKPPREKPMPAC